MLVIQSSFIKEWPENLVELLVGEPGEPHVLKDRGKVGTVHVRGAGPVQQKLHQTKLVDARLLVADQGDHLLGTQLLHIISISRFYI